jgi:hypothetical protein
VGNCLLGARNAGDLVGNLAGARQTGRDGRGVGRRVVTFELCVRCGSGEVLSLPVLLLALTGGDGHFCHPLSLSN